MAGKDNFFYRNYINFSGKEENFSEDFLDKFLRSYDVSLTPTLYCPQTFTPKKFLIYKTISGEWLRHEDTYLSPKKIQDLSGFKNTSDEVKLFFDDLFEKIEMLPIKKLIVWKRISQNFK